MFTFDKAAVGKRVFFETGFSFDWCLPSTGTIDMVVCDEAGRVEKVWVTAGDKRVLCDETAIVSVI